MGAGENGGFMLRQVFCCRARNEAGRFDLEEPKERGRSEVRSTCFPCQFPVCSQGVPSGAGVGTKQIMGGGKLGVEDLWDPLEMGRVRMLLQVACCQGRNKTGDWTWRNGGGGKDLQSAYILPWQE